MNQFPSIHIPPAAMARTAAVVAFASMLSACGAGKLMVMDPAQAKKGSTITIKESDATAPVAPEASAAFRKKLGEIVHAPGAIPQGSDVTLSYRFVQYEEGSQFKRWLTGGIGNSGEGSLTVEAVYLDAAGKALGKVVAEGKIGSGFFGGSISSAVEKCAEQIGDYTLKNFK